jgi:hypothetical protein
MVSERCHGLFVGRGLLFRCVWDIIFVGGVDLRDMAGLLRSVLNVHMDCQLWISSLSEEA